MMKVLFKVVICCKMNFLMGQVKVKKWVRMNLWTLMSKCYKKWMRKEKMKILKS